MMNRRRFVSSAGLGAIYASMPGSHLFAAEKDLALSGKKDFTAGELNSYLRSLCDVDEPSVDRIIIGNPDTPVKKIGTAWMPYWDTCKEAVKQGVNVLVVHEPTFYSHWDLGDDRWNNINTPSPGQQKYLDTIDEKAAWIRKNELVIIRCHDVLDKIGGIGIPFAFGRALGFLDSEIVRSRTFYNVYQVETQPAIDVARRISSKLNAVGQPGVAFYGDENFQVKTVGLGTGCICNPLEFMDLEMDLAIAIDDSISTWTQTTFAEDTGRPLVVVNHGSTEEFGMNELSLHLSKALTDYEVLHFNQGCTYSWITG